jgi:hypothetical protein
MAKERKPKSESRILRFKAFATRRGLVRVSFADYLGHYGLDFRLYVPAEDPTGDHRPTKSGVRFSIALIDEVLEELNAIRAQAVVLGLLSSAEKQEDEH